ncbi:hypothetical protein [Agaribacterium haliotis]|uniref:hypothetical protein n=1 Tax=Agaribacterium haliotis TaxID=2013869 RepID=UPI000BB52D3C|nr:hypothetical protein [Agaribacterium haliotis]
MSNSDLIEVTLVDEIKNCRDCRWFWADIPPYGPHLSWQWQEAYPETIKQREKQSQGRRREPWINGITTDPAQIDPAVMHGCRKAPIMTIGINPNMTSYFASESGSEWAYPHFSSAEQYAYYYRYQTIYQESLDKKDLEKWAIDDASPEQELIANKRGWLLDAKRSSDHRWLEIRYQYENEDKVRVFETSWSLEEKACVMVGRSRAGSSRFSFNKGDKIVARIRAQKDEKVTIYKNTVKYYQRFIPVLEQFKQLVGSELENANLSVGEDVSQHDIIHCASPGWSSAYDIPTENITRHCVDERAYLAKQLLQSQPKVIFIVGGSTLSMFAKNLGKYLDFAYLNDHNDESSIKDTFQLMKETTERRCMLRIQTGNFAYEARVIVVPHFSYDDNYRSHSRLSAKSWDAFKADFPADYKALEQQKLIGQTSWNGFIPIDVTKANALSVAARQVLEAFYVDPYSAMAKALAAEYRDGYLSLDHNTGQLSRVSGNCKYCDNERWQFPGGCLYGNDKEQRDYPDLANIKL